MGQPVKLSESLVLDVRLTGEVAERSIAGQIEFWAGLGRAVESLLRSDIALALKKRGEAMPLSACLKSVNSRAGRSCRFSTTAIYAIPSEKWSNARTAKSCLPPNPCRSG